MFFVLQRQVLFLSFSGLDGVEIRFSILISADLALTLNHVANVIPITNKILLWLPNLGDGKKYFDYCLYSLKLNF